MIGWGIVASLLLVTTVFAQQPAFPTAEGWGRFAAGGRGDGTDGFVCHVNTLSAASTGALIGGTLHHAGSLRYCWGLSGPRTIVFDVGGTIDHTGNKDDVTNGGFTMAGQTAPGVDGVQVIGADTNMLDGDIIIRHMRFRPGSGVSNPDIAEALAIHDANFIVDHSSFSWGTDEVTEIYNTTPLNTTDGTFQWCIISEGLQNSTHSEQNRAYGMISTGSTRITIFHNLFAHNKDRNPIVGEGDWQYVNNVCYNCGRGFIAQTSFSAPLFANIIANYFKPGSNGGNTNLVALRDGELQSGVSQIYVNGNIHPTIRANNTLAEDLVVFRGGNGAQITINGSPFSFPSLSVTDAFDAYDDVLANAGAQKPARDVVDARIVDDVVNSTGVWIDDPSDVGGFPTFAAGTPATDTDSDGVPDTWETLCGSTLGGLSLSDSTDGNDIISGVDSAVNGYSKLEVYLNELAGDYPLNSCGGLLALAFILDGVVDAVAGLSTMAFIPNGSIGSVGGVSGLSIIPTGVIDTITGISSLGFLSNGTIDTVVFQ